MPTVFTTDDGNWKIHTETQLDTGKSYYVFHYHWERSRLRRQSRGMDYYWAWCYRSMCSECNRPAPDGIQALIVMLEMKGEV
jgi:hypothetical protein